MKKTLLTSCLAGLFFLGMTAMANALLLTPGDAGWQGSVPNNPDPADIASIVGSSETFTSWAYKQDVGGPESGSFASSYETEYLNEPLDPQDANITWVGPDVIDCPECYLIVKDGNQDPIWYIFDLASWDGMETISLTGFWPRQGAISHIGIVGGEPVPEPATMLLLGTGLAGLAGVSRRRTKK